MKKCVICGRILDKENKSMEHIIPNAIGGTLKSDKIYCKECNQQYGANLDKKFIQIFAPIIDNLNIHKDRKTKGTSYTGILIDSNGNSYTATFKNGKVVKLDDKDIRYEKDKFYTKGYHFDLDNKAFKLGISKIAFNYAIYCEIPSQYLEKIFNYRDKKLIESTAVIPFIPLTPFDTIMEMIPVAKIFHAVRIFNNKNSLYAYVSLFNTFQYYVLLSEKYDFEKQGDIDKSYGNIIEKKGLLDTHLLEILTPKDPKDADIIIHQYHINVNELINQLIKYRNYDNIDREQRTIMLYSRIGSKACEELRKDQYIREYEPLVNQHYDICPFKDIFESIDDFDMRMEFFKSFQFYTIYENDKVNLSNYKRILPSGKDYISAISGNLANENFQIYGYMKFQMLNKHFCRK